jgi:hypothetical protein
VEWGRQCGTAKPRAAGVEFAADGHVEPILHGDAVSDTQSFEEAEVRRATAQEDMLAVVYPEAFAWERVGEPAETRT